MRLVIPCVQLVTAKINTSALLVRRGLVLSNGSTNVSHSVQLEALYSLSKANKNVKNVMKDALNARAHLIIAPNVTKTIYSINLLA